jgi:quercetin dioxygenase-like cupin family protein
MDVRHLSSFRTFSAEKLTKHNLFASPRFFLDVYCLRVGQSQTAHVHPESDKIYLVLEGSCRFIVGSEAENHGAGTAVFAPAGSQHGIESIGPGDARVLVFMTPPPGKR